MPHTKPMANPSTFLPPFPNLVPGLNMYSSPLAGKLQQHFAIFYFTSYTKEKKCPPVPGIFLEFTSILQSICIFSCIFLKGFLEEKNIAGSQDQIYDPHRGIAQIIGQDPR
jgi:hypothetical protein